MASCVKQDIAFDWLCIININILPMLNQIWFQDQTEGSIETKEEKKFRIKPKGSLLLHPKFCDIMG